VRLLSILRLASPALPVGAYAWSTGLESAIEAGVVGNTVDATAWIEDALSLGLARWDLPILGRIMAAIVVDDAEGVASWNALFLASRETAELLQETEGTGAALMRLLRDLGTAPPLALPARVAYPTALAVAATVWGISTHEASQVLAYGFVENQISVLCKALPLGQVAAQRILGGLVAEDGPISEAVRIAATLADADLVSSLPSLAVLSAQHETQYSRLFRS